MKLRSGTEAGKEGGGERSSAVANNPRKGNSRKSSRKAAEERSSNGDLSGTEGRPAPATAPPTAPAGNDQSYPRNGVGSHGLNGPKTPKLKKHPWWVVLALRTFAAYLVFMFFIVPTVLKTCPWILSEITFLYRVRWPPFLDLDNPSEAGINQTNTFTIDVNKNVLLGAWHVLPKSLYKPETPKSQYTNLLKEGSPIILYLHGNSGTRAGWHRVQLYKVLSDAGYHVVTMDYRGYGDSTGSPTEAGLVEDAMAAYRWVLKHSGKSKVYIWGHSLGSGVAVQLTRQVCDAGEAVSGLILEAPIYNMKEAAYHHPFTRPFRPMPYYSWVFVQGLEDNNISFPNDQILPTLPTPSLILHAEDDFIVPFELGKKLYEEAAAKKQVGGVEFVRFDDSHGYGHKHIHKSADLPHTIRKFTNNLA